MQGINATQLLKDIPHIPQQGKPVRLVNLDLGETDVYDITCVGVGPNGELELMIRYCDTEDDHAADVLANSDVMSGE